MGRGWIHAALERFSVGFRRAVGGPTSCVLGLRDGDELLGTAIVGHDGHRGRIYYLAVRSERRRQGLGRVRQTASEDWLRTKSAVKIHLMVRRGNESALGFYQQIDYEESDVVVLSRWLTTSVD